MKIDMSYGSGGKQTASLIRDIFLKYFDNPVLNKLEDGAVLDISGKIAYTTDSFVVTPLFFKGGDIGKLAVCGTANDLASMGAVPLYLTVGFIIEEGTDIETIEKICFSMKSVADEANVKIVAGDTKVIEGNASVYINTSGIGQVLIPNVSISNCTPDDAVILTGSLGDHHAAILSERMGISNNIQSDCAPLNKIVSSLFENNIYPHCMRDVTRGGLATVLNEVSEQSKCKVNIIESKIPVTSEVKGFCDILGLDPLYMGNEGKMIIVVPKSQADEALDIIGKNEYGKNSAIIGSISKGSGVQLTTKLMGTRIIDVLYGEGLPRIC